MAKKDIETKVDLSDRPDDQLRQLVAVGTVIAARANAIVKEAKANLMDRIEPGEHPRAVFGGVSLGELTRTKGGDGGRYRVSDPVAFGGWLKANGFADYFEELPVATRDAADPGWLRNLIEKDMEGEIPDGVAYSAPAAPQVKFSLDVEQAERLFDSDPSAMMALLEPPATEPAPEAGRTATEEADPLAELGL